MQGKIIAAIAAYLDSKTLYRDSGNGVSTEFIYVYPTKPIAIAEITAELAAAIAPHLEAGADFPYDKLFDHMANEHGLTLTNTELGDIIHVARSEGTGAGWEDAPSWAEWRTVDGNGDITYWKDKPEPSKRNDYWTLAKGDRYEQIPHTVKDWKETLQKRPR